MLRRFSTTYVCKSGHTGTCSHLSIGVHACKCIVVLIGARCWQTRHGRVHSCLTAPLQEAGDFAVIAYFVLKSRCGEVSVIVCMYVCAVHANVQGIEVSYMWPYRYL